MYISIDIGGTNIRIASFGQDNQLVKKTSFEAGKDFESVVAKIASEIKKISDGEEIKGVGIAAPGLIDTKNKMILDSANLPSWNNKPLGRYLESKLNTEVRIDNDMLVAAIGEYLFGHGVNEKEFLFIIWGTGFGGAWIRKINNKVDAKSIELGHQILVWEGELCGCKQRGCAETYVGGGYAKQTYGENFSDNTSEEIWEKVSQKAGHALVNSINHFPVDLMVFGGGVVNKQPHLIDRTKKVIQEQLTTYPIPEMKLSKLNEEGGLYGGMGLFLIDRI